MSTNEQWHVDPCLPVLVVDSSGNCVASSFIGVPGCAEALAKAEARARLIAQAPAMAEALYRLSLRVRVVDLLGELDPMLHDEIGAILSQLEAKP